MVSLSKSEIALHWVVGLGMIALIALGIYMEQQEAFALFPIHKSFGMVLFVFILLRVVLRLRKGWPENVSKGKAWEHGIARVVHWVLIIGTLVMPISGMLEAAMGGRGLYLFGMELLVASPVPSGADDPLPINEPLAELGARLHGLFANILLAAIALHVLGALKHHFLDRDGTLRRMLGHQETA